MQKKSACISLFSLHLQFFGRSVVAAAEGGPWSADPVETMMSPGQPELQTCLCRRSALWISLWSQGINAVSEILSFFHTVNFSAPKELYGHTDGPYSKSGGGLYSWVMWKTQFSLRRHLVLLKNWRGFSDFMVGGTGFPKTQLLLRVAV